MVKRFDVYWVSLDPAFGTEMKKVRPCVVLSPNSLNAHLSVVIVAPLTTSHRSYPTRVDVTVGGKKGQVALDQIRSYDKKRLGKHLETLDSKTQRTLCEKLQELFLF